MICHQCGRSLNAAQTATGFCPSCGAAVRAAEPEPVTPPPAETPALEIASAWPEKAAPVADAAPVAEPAIETAAAPAAEVVSEPAADPVAAAPMLDAAPAAEPTVVADAAPVVETAAIIAAVPVVEAAPATPPIAEAPLVAEAAPMAEISDAPEPAPVAAPASPPAAEAVPVAAAAPMPIAAATTPPAPTLPRATPPAPARSPSRTSALAISLVIALLLVAAIALFGLGKAGTGPLAGALGPTATPQPTATPTATPLPPTPTPLAGVPTPAVGFTPFLSTDGAYALNFPNTWVTITQNIAATNTTAQAFATLDTKDVCIVLPLSMTLTPDQFAPTLQQILQNTPNATNVLINPTTTSVTLGANTWTKITGTFDYNGEPQDAVALVTPHDAGSYVLLYFAPTADFSTVETASFTPIVQSFTFLKP